VGHEKQNLDRRLTHTHVAVYADSKDFPKDFVFSQLNLTKRMTFMSKFTKLHS
jgi:hypothetical protein